MGSSPLSVRLPGDLLKRLERRAKRKGLPKSVLVERYLDEGMRMEEHPGIVFREGPAGRRAALRRGPDVWEVIATIRANGGAVAAAAEALGLPESEIRIALAYYGDHSEEIDEWVRENEEEAGRAQEAWLRQRAIARD